MDSSVDDETEDEPSQGKHGKEYDSSGRETKITIGVKSCNDSTFCTAANHVIPDWIKPGIKCMARYQGDNLHYRAVIQGIHGDSNEAEVLVSFNGFESEANEVVQIKDLKRIPQKELPVDTGTPIEPRELSHSFFTHLQGHEMEEGLRTKYEDDIEDFEEVLVKDMKSKSKKRKGILDVSTQKGKVSKHRKKPKLNKNEQEPSSPVGSHTRNIAATSSSTSMAKGVNGHDDDDDNNDGADDDYKAELRDRMDGFDEKDMEKPHFNEPAPHPFVPLVLSDPEQQPVVQIPATINCHLRKYQREGIQFLYKHYHANHGAILADDMGLGKTIQVISLLAAVLGKTGTMLDVLGKYLEDKDAHGKKATSISKETGCFLIITPGSVLYNWRDELDAWGYFKVRFYHGNSKEGVLEQAAKAKLDVVLTTFETFKKNLDSFNRVSWLAVIMDEAHKLKDPKAQITVAAKALKVKRRYGLTGTPLQNRFAEFWSVLDWANPGCLGSSKTFIKQYSRPIKKGQRFNVTKRELAVGRTMSEKLQSKLSQWFLRRTKDLISDQLPLKDDKVVFCTMTSFQEDVYVTLLQSPDVKLITKKDVPCDCGSGFARGKCCYMTDKEGEPLRTVLMRFLQLLLKAANHTALFMPQVRQTDDQRRKAKAICGQVFARHPEYAESLRTSSFQTLSDPSYCGKMKVLDRLLRMFEKERSKVLLFSQSFQLLNILEEYVIGRGMIYSRLDGKTKTSQRAVIVREFNNNPDIFVCLVSTRAGALGLNFTGANVVIIFDPTWNPANDLQAQDRAYRIGQRRDVQVFRLISSGTIEEMMYLRQIYKQQMSNIAVKGTSERRYFTGVEGEKDLKGELFGIENLFSYRSEGVSLAQDIIARTDRLEAGLRVEKNRIVERSKENHEDRGIDEEVPHSKVSEEDEYDVENVASQLFGDESFGHTSGIEPSASGLKREGEEENPGNLGEGEKSGSEGEHSTGAAGENQINEKKKCCSGKEASHSKPPKNTNKSKKHQKKHRKSVHSSKTSREKRFKMFLKEFFSNSETSESSQEAQRHRHSPKPQTKTLKKYGLPNYQEMFGLIKGRDKNKETGKSLLKHCNGSKEGRRGSLIYSKPTTRNGNSGGGNSVDTIRDTTKDHRESSPQNSTKQFTKVKKYQQLSTKRRVCSNRSGSSKGSPTVDFSISSLEDAGDNESNIRKSGYRDGEHNNGGDDDDNVDSNGDEDDDDNNGNGDDVDDNGDNDDHDDSKSCGNGDDDDHGDDDDDDGDDDDGDLGDDVDDDDDNKDDDDVYKDSDVDIDAHPSSTSNASCLNIHVAQGGYFSLSEGEDTLDHSQDISSKTPKKVISRRERKVAVVTPQRSKLKVVAKGKDVIRSKRTKVQELLSECGVNYTHANQSVVRSSAAENHMSKRAIQDVFQLRQHSQQPANCFASLQVSDESDDVAEYSTKLRDKRSSEQRMLSLPFERPINKAPSKVINTLSEAVDHTADGSEIKSGSEAKIDKTTKAASNSKKGRREMAARHFRRKGVVFHDDDDHDDDDVIRAKTEKTCASALELPVSLSTNTRDNNEYTTDHKVNNDVKTSYHVNGPRTGLDDVIDMSRDLDQGTSLVERSSNGQQGPHLSLSFFDEFLESKSKGESKSNRDEENYFGSFKASDANSQSDACMRNTKGVSLYVLETLESGTDRERRNAILDDFI